MEQVQTVEFMFSNVTYGPTVYKTGIKLSVGEYNKKGVTWKTTTSRR